MKISSQSKLSLVNKTGKLETSKITRQSGLCDVVNFQTLKKGNWHSFKIVFDSKGASYGCLDKAGNVTIFHLDKNRYTNVDVKVDSSNLTFIDNKGAGLLLVSFQDCSIGVYNILNGKQIQQMKWHKFKIQKLQVNPTSSVVLSVTAEDCVLWDTNTFERKKSFFTKSSRFLSAALPPSGNSLITFSTNGMIESYNVETQKVELSEDTGLKWKSGFVEISVEGDYFAIAGETSVIMIGRTEGWIGEKGDPGACFGLESFELPSSAKKVQKIKFIGNSLLTVLADDSKIYTFSAKNHMEVVMAFNLCENKGIIDYDLSVQAKHLVVISTLGEKYVYDYHTLIQNAKAQKSQNSLKNGSFARESLRRIDLDDLRAQTREQQQLRQTGSKENSYRQNYLKAPSDLIMIDKVGGATGDTEVYVNGALRASNRNGNGSTNSYEESYLSIPKLREFLTRFGSYPDRHRQITWSYLLGLPSNDNAYQNLAKKGLHTNFLNLREVFPIESTKLYYRMQRMLSCLAFYCPIFAELPYLPGLIFPFVKLLGVNESFCFETILSFFIQHGQHFFEFAPNPPVSYINAILDLIKIEDPQFHAALTSNIAHVQLINAIWSSISICATDMLKKDDWLCFIDFIVSRSQTPEMLLHFYVAYFLTYRERIGRITSGAQLVSFFESDHGIRIQDLLARALKLSGKGNEARLQISFTDNLPLTREQYPIFNFFPKYSLDQHREIRQAIIEDELKAREQKRTEEQLKALTIKLAALEKNCEDQKDSMIRHDRERRDIQMYEEEMRLTRVIAAEQEARDSRVRQIKEIERESRATIDLANHTKKQELNLIDQEIAKKRAIDNQFIASQLEEETLMNLELKTAGRLHEVLEANSKEQRKNSEALTNQLVKNQVTLKYQNLSRQNAAAVEEDIIRQSHQQQRKQLRHEIEREVIEARQTKGAQLAEEFERELQLAEQERDRRIKQIEAGELAKKDELDNVQRLQEEVLRAEQDVHLKRLEGLDYDIARAHTAERLKILEEEKQQELYELQEHRKHLKVMQQQQMRAQAEEKIQDYRAGMQGTQLEEEQRLQQAIEEIQRDRQAQRQIQQDIEFKEQEAMQSDQYRRILKLQKQAILDEEEASYQNFQSKVAQQQKQQSNYNTANSQYYQQQQHQQHPTSATAGFSQDNFYGTSQQGQSTTDQYYDGYGQNNLTGSYAAGNQNPFNNTQAQYRGDHDQYDYMQDSINQHSRHY